MKKHILQTVIVAFLFNINLIANAFSIEYENNLIGLYPFNDNSKNFIDNRFDGIQNNVSFIDNREGETKSACQFYNPDNDNTSSFIEIPNIDNKFNLNNATISIWIKYASIPTENYIMQRITCTKLIIFFKKHVHQQLLGNAKIA